MKKQEMLIKLIEETIPARLGGKVINCWFGGVVDTQLPEGNGLSAFMVDETCERIASPLQVVGSEVERIIDTYWGAYTTAALSSALVPSNREQMLEDLSESFADEFTLTLFTKPANMVAHIDDTTNLEGVFVFAYVFTDPDDGHGLPYVFNAQRLLECHLQGNTKILTPEHYVTF